MPKVLQNTEPVNHYITIHPALDFWDNKAIVAIGCKWQETYQVYTNSGKPKGTEIHFVNAPYCITSNGDNFRLNREELAKRQLYYNGKIELPEITRWQYEDIQKFSDDNNSITFKQLFELIRKEYEYYVDYIDERFYDLLTCFVVYTYFYPLFFNAPVLQFWGEMRTGKTKNLMLLEAMAFNPVNSANISCSSVFRLIESRRATILFDESEDLMTSERAREIRNMLLAGTGKSGETFRQEKQDNDTYSTKSYRIFSPKVIANIAGIDLPALLSRSIRISTVATQNKDKDNRCVELEDEKWQYIRNQLYRVCLSRFNEVEAVRDCIKDIEGINGRSFYMWHGILTIAKLTNDSNVFDSLVKLAIENKEEMEAEIALYNEQPEEMVRLLIKLCQDNPEQEYFSGEEIMDVLIDFNVSSPKDLANKMGKLGLKSRNLTKDGKCRRYYRLTVEILKRRLKS
jgi:hypothetical protein